MNAQRTAVVIIGGGVIGCSIAWHLTRRGQRDVIVVERNDLGSGATSRSAGLVARGRLHPPAMTMVRQTREAFDALEALGHDAGFQRVGSLRVAASEPRAQELASMDAMLAQAGIAVRNPDAAEAREMARLLDTTTALRRSYVEDDGYVDAYRLTTAYAAAARAAGVRILPRTEVQAVLHTAGRVTGVNTSAGEIHADTVINAGGAWGIGLALAAGYPMGAAPTRSHYYITAPLPDVPRAFPLIYLPDARAYARPEVGGVLLGVQEPRSRTYDASTLPADIGTYPLSDAGNEWAELAEHADTLRPFFPALDRWPLAHHITGLSTYTPDGRFLLGRAGPLAGYLVAGGCCGTGVSCSGGIGDALAALALDQAPVADLTDFDAMRFGEIDPCTPAFRERCAAARAGKLRLG